MTRFVLGTVFGLSLCCSAVTEAAQFYGPGGHCGNVGANWWGGYSYGIVHREEVPHFALYPPVYYSQPVPRTYGYSPFAYPAGVMTPEIADEKSGVIINPYVPQSEAPPAESQEKPTGLRVTSSVRVIENPYVGAGNSLASSRAK